MGARKQPTPAPGPGIIKPDPPPGPPTCRSPGPPSTPPGVNLSSAPGPMQKPPLAVAGSVVPAWPSGTGTFVGTGDSEEFDKETCKWCGQELGLHGEPWGLAIDGCPVYLRPIPQGAGRVVPYVGPAEAIMIGSALVHADELLETLHPMQGEPIDRNAYIFDVAALRAILDQPQVQAWLASFPPGLLPEKRGGP